MLSDREVVFFRALQQPFHPSKVRQRSQGGVTLSYITARDVQNRLDSVCGPSNWNCEYRELPNGSIVCRLSIRVPVGSTDGFEWISKEEGGAAAGMKEGDNDAKSGFSDAFKRAGIVWGIGRDLYKSGLPDYMDGVQHETSSEPVQATTEGRNTPPAKQKDYSLTQIPKPGTKATFAWIKALETHYGIGFVKGFVTIAKGLGASDGMTSNWDEEIWYGTVRKFLSFLKTKDYYDGTFDSITEDQLTPTGIDYSKI